MKPIFKAIALAVLACIIATDCRAQPGEVLRWRLDYLGPPRTAVSSSPLQDSLVAYYGMEESSGTRYDGHGTNHLTAYNNPGDTVGVMGSAATFDNVQSQYLQNTGAQLGAMNQSFTLMWWQKRYAPLDGANVTAVNRGTATNSTVNTEFSAFGGFNAFSFRIVTGGALRNVNHNTANSDAWQHLMMVFDRSKDTLTVYYNGVFMNKAYAPGAMNTVSPFTLGANGTGGEPFYGVIDEVYLWRGHAVSAGFVMWYYNSAAGRSYAAVIKYTD